VAICYEISDGAALAAAARQGAGWLLASANLDPYPAQLKGQFTALARLRAIESGRWLVSSANTGPSLLVDAHGRVLLDLPAGIPASGAMAVRRRSRLTAYSRWGEAPLLLLLIGACGCRWRTRTCGKVDSSRSLSSEAPCPGGWT
jgi:apolipoprotein N-acyltransferase